MVNLETSIYYTKILAPVISILPPIPLTLSFIRSNPFHPTPHLSHIHFEEGFFFNITPTACKAKDYCGGYRDLREKNERLRDKWCPCNERGGTQIISSQFLSFPLRLQNAHRNFFFMQLGNKKWRRLGQRERLREMKILTRCERYLFFALLWYFVALYPVYMLSICTLLNLIPLSLTLSPFLSSSSFSSPSIHLIRHN